MPGCLVGPRWQQETVPPSAKAPAFRPDAQRAAAPGGLGQLLLQADQSTGASVPRRLDQTWHENIPPALPGGMHSEASPPVAHKPSRTAAAVGTPLTEQDVGYQDEPHALHDDEHAPSLCTRGCCQFPLQLCLRCKPGPVVHKHNADPNFMLNPTVSPPLNRMWATWMNQMPCMMMSMGRAAARRKLLGRHISPTMTTKVDKIVMTNRVCTLTSSAYPCRHIIGGFVAYLVYVKECSMALCCHGSVWQARREQVPCCGLLQGSRSKTRSH